MHVTFRTDFLRSNIYLGNIIHSLLVMNYFVMNYACVWDKIHFVIKYSIFCDELLFLSLVIFSDGALATNLAIKFFSSPNILGDIFLVTNYFLWLDV